ncbi:hypothetical protein BDP27DRAFT_316506 [Rhodocollybia butyracea]|uniref:Uncharacterized protein n=1 Tax=Rhodocollybia butyracea TaxID=206335 RepID=A0A9P5UBM0_9AGAR|nr:hypothetical protein BDP27DRAFT_316506 [Rhodocollybia butyracea]
MGQPLYSSQPSAGELESDHQAIGEASARFQTQDSLSKRVRGKVDFLVSELRSTIHGAGAQEELGEEELSENSEPVSEWYDDSPIPWIRRTPSGSFEMSSHRPPSSYAHPVLDLATGELVQEEERVSDDEEGDSSSDESDYGELLRKEERVFDEGGDSSNDESDDYEGYQTAETGEEEEEDRADPDVFFSDEGSDSDEKEHGSSRM